MAGRSQVRWSVIDQIHAGRKVWHVTIDRNSSRFSGVERILHPDSRIWHIICVIRSAIGIREVECMGLPVEYSWLLIRIDEAYHAASRQWQGCDFNTEFGNSKINLKDLRSSQALLLARATSGKERMDWHAAVTWLEAVEEDAHHADAEARRAVDLAHSGLLGEASQHAQAACELEAKYHDRLLWRPFQQLIELACIGTCDACDVHPRPS